MSFYELYLRLERCLPVLCHILKGILEITKLHLQFLMLVPNLRHLPTKHITLFLQLITPLECSLVLFLPQLQLYYHITHVPSHSGYRYTSPCPQSHLLIISYPFWKCVWSHGSTSSQAS